MPNNIIFTATAGQSSVRWGNTPTTPTLPSLELVGPSAGTVDTAISGGRVINNGASSALFILSSSPSATITPSSGTVPAGGSVDYTFTPSTAIEHTITLTNVSGGSTTGSPALFTPDAAAPVVGTTVATLKAYASTTGTTLPYSATVLPLEGDVPTGFTLESPDDATLKASVLSTHSDGSAAVMVVSGHTDGTAGSTGTIRLQTATAGSSTAMTASAISALLTNITVSFGSYGTTVLSNFSSPSRTWWANARTICARYVIDPPSPGSTALQAVVDVHAYSGRAFVEVVVENCKMTTASPTAPAAATYTGATVSINGGAAIATVDASGAYEGEHSKFRAWYASAWIGGNPGLRVTQTHTELQLHPMFWKMAAASTASLTAYGALTYTPWSPVSHSTSMGATGDHPDIGPLPMWSARALQTGDYRAWNAVEVNDLGALTYDINYRDSTTGLPPTIAELNGKSMQTNWPNLYAGSHPGGGTGWKDSHHPACGLMGFISRPSPVFIEIAQKVAVWCGTWSRNDNGATERDTGIYVSAYQTRGKAWGIRSLGHATFLTPDALPWKAAGKASLTANLAYLDEWRTTPLQTGLAIMWELRKDLPYNRNTWVPRVNYKLWQHHYLLWEVAKIASARIVAPANQTAADTCADWLLSHSVKWVNDQAATGSWRYMPEALVLGNASETSPAMTNAADYATQRATWVTGSPASVTGLWQRNATDMPQDYTSWLDDTLADVSRATYYWPTLVAAVDRGIAGAATAYNTVINGITNFSTWVTGFGTEARYAATPINPPAPAGFAAGTVTGGSYNSTTKVWTPEKTGAGVVKALSWAEVPTGEWVEIGGSRIDTLTAEITALGTGWGASQLAWNAVLNAWNGVAIDQDGSRVWLVAAGGHADSSNNGVYRFDCFTMAWAVERAPSDRTPWSTLYRNLGPAPDNTWTYCGESATASPQAAFGEEAATASARKYFFDQLFWDGRPTSRHVYSTPVYKASTNELIMGARSIWKFNVTTGDWTYNRRWSGEVDGAEIQGVYDEVADQYLFAGMGDTRRRSETYNVAANTFGTVGWCPWIGIAADGDGWEGVADTRHGRNVTVWSPPFSDRTKQHYAVYNLDSRTQTVGPLKPVYGGGLSAADFKSTSSGADGAGMVYVPPLNEYWILYQMVSGTRWLKLDPTTSPWTISPKTFTGTLPAVYDKPCRKIVWMPDLNAVMLWSRDDRGAYVYKF